MALRRIIKLGDELLRKKSREVTEFDSRLHELLDDMNETLHYAKGAGLAAVQVGVLRRVFIVDMGDGVEEYINPVIIKADGKCVDREGCLSIPDENAVIVRPKKVKLKARDRYGNEFTASFTEYHARAICHEIDHLDGKLYIDLIDPKLQTEG